MTDQPKTDIPSKDMLILAVKLAMFLMGAEDAGFRFTVEPCELSPESGWLDVYMTDTHDGKKLSVHHLEELDG